MVVAILNSPIITAPGVYRCREISLEEAISLVQENDYQSYIGHDSTARVLSQLLGTEIPYNRGMFKQEKGQKAIVFRLNTRLEEGRVLDESELSQLNYQLLLLEKLDD